MENITFEKFKETDLRMATILQAEKVEGSDKLVKLQIDLGEELGQRQIVAGVGLSYTPEELVGKQIIIVANLEPKVLMGQESQGMLLAADEAGISILLQPDKKVLNGARVK